MLHDTSQIKSNHTLSIVFCEVFREFLLQEVVFKLVEKEKTSEIQIKLSRNQTQNATKED